MSILDNIKDLKSGYKKGYFKNFDGTTIDMTATEVKNSFSSLKKKVNPKNEKKEKVYLQCKNCGHYEEINLELFVKIIGGATVGFGAIAWPTFLFAGTGFAWPLCLAIIAGGTAMLAGSKQLTEWFSKKYTCTNCGRSDWDTITGKELALKEKLKEKEFAVEHEKAKQNNSFFARYNSVDAIPILHQLYQEAKEYIYISYGWITKFCAEQDLPYLKAAANRGVKITIYYGIEPLKDRSNGKYTNTCLIKLKNTIEAINYLKAGLPSTATFVLTDTHTKITVCEKYTLHGSHNLLSYRPDKKGRSEYTDKTDREIEIQTDIKTILEQKPRPELELLVKNL